MSDEHTNDGPTDDLPVDDADLGAGLRQLAPGPGPGFWAAVDARLAAAAPAATAATAAAGDEPAAADDATSDTGVTVVRLTDMTTHRANRFRSPRSLLTAAAAAVLVVAAGGATLAAIRPDGGADGVAAVSPDANPDSDSDSGPDSGTGTGTGTDAGPTVALPTLRSTDGRPAAGTYCYRVDDLSGDGNAAVLQLEIDATGMASAIEVPDPRAGVGPVATAGWFVTERDLLMQGSDESTATGIWTVLATGLQLAEDVFYLPADCAEVAPTAAGAGVSVAAAVTPGSGSGPAPGRRCFATGSGPVEGTYEVDVDEAGQVSVVSRIFDDGAPALVMTGTGFAVSPTELVLIAVAAPDEATLERNDAGEPATLWTMTGDTLGFGLGLTADAVDCEGGSTDEAPSGGPTAEDLTTGVTFRVDDRLTFESDATSATVTGNVVLGERDRYLVEARAGQTLTVTAAAVDDNASVAVIDPSGTVLTYETAGDSVVLEVPGAHQIIVGPSRGNLSYTLTVEITGP